MIAFSCSHCGTELQIKAEFAGKVAKCPECSRSVTVPESVTVRTEANDDVVRGQTASSRPTFDNTAADDVLLESSAAADTVPPLPIPATPSRGYDFLAPPQLPDEMGRLGPYRVLKVLGAGGMGVVFLAEDPRLRRPVALKAMLPGTAATDSAMERFLREARLTAAIKHDHIVCIYQVDEDRGAPYLAMEFLEGESLHDRVKRERILPVQEVLRIGREIAEGLAAAHGRGLIHRDIKPANIWLEGDRGRVKLLDFGLARSTNDDMELTMTGAVLGTPAYMAPEQAQALAVDHRCDLFSLGCVLYRLCTGDTPFKGSDPLSMALAIVADEPKPPDELNADLPPELSRLILQLLAKDPEKRPASAGAVAAALRAMEDDPTVVLAPIPAPGYAGTLPPRRGRVFRIAVGIVSVLCVGALLVAGTIYLTRTPRGTLLVKVPETDVEVVIDGKRLVTIGADKSGRVELKAGDHHLVVKRGDKELYSEAFNVAVGGETSIDAKWVSNSPPTPLPPPKGGVDETWIKFVAALKPEDQGKAVATKLQELNPGFDGKYTHAVENGKVTTFKFSSNSVADLAPVKALTGLQDLSCAGLPAERRSPIADLTPLKGLPLKRLDCNHTSVTDLSPIHEMQLTDLWISVTEVTDLSPLRGMPLTHLSCIATPVTDLSPLQGLPLKDLRCTFRWWRDADVVRRLRTLEKINLKSIPEFWKEADEKRSEFDAWSKSLAPLSAADQAKAVIAKMRELNSAFEGKYTFHAASGFVTRIEFSADNVTDLSPLRALNGLRGVRCSGSARARSRLFDLTPLRDLKLTSLNCSATRVTDLVALKDLKLTELNCSETLVTDLTPLKEMPLEDLRFRRTAVADLAPLKGMKKLAYLDCDETKVTALGTLRGLPLQTLYCNRTGVADLTPLQGAPLNYLNCQETAVTTLAPLRGLPVKEINCDFKPSRDAEVLRSIKTLEKLNGKPAAELLKEVAGK